MGWSIGERWSRSLADLDLWVVLDGRGWMRVGSQRMDLHPGVAVLARPGRSYEASQDLENRMVIDALHFELLDEAGEPLGEAGLPPIRLAVPDMAVASALTRRLLDRYHARTSDADWRNDPVPAGLLRGFLLDLDQTTRAEASITSGVAWEHRLAVTQAEAQLRENLATPPSVAELAARAGYSPDHFGRIFKQITGRSPQAATIAARLDRARHLLRVTPMNVTQIADALGYADVFFFSRQFKKFTGQSPTAFRRAALEPAPRETEG
ncbi:MAG: AraC family transcriptional regulator [Planctomycetota bacterium]